MLLTLINKCQIFVIKSSNLSNNQNDQKCIPKPTVFMFKYGNERS